MESLWTEAWENTDRTADELRLAALAELEAAGTPGGACREIVVKAAGYLAANGWMKPQISGRREVERDQRQPSVVLDAMHRSVHGIYQLAEALAAGRRGETARAVDETGTPIARAGGDAKPLTNEWLRETFNEIPAATDTMPLLPVSQNARERVGAKVTTVGKLTGDVARALDEAMSIHDDDGNPYLERNGWPRHQTKPIADRLRELAVQLDELGVRSEMTLELPSAGRAEQLDLEPLEEVA